MGNGPHTASAVAKDLAGITATSASVSFSVNNPSIVPSCATPATNAFLGCYYTGQNFNKLVFSRLDLAISFDWSGVGPRGPVALGPDNYSVRWLGSFSFGAGTYQFTVNTDDGEVLYIDGQPVYSNWVPHGSYPVMVNVPLTAGTHVVRLDYFQQAGGAIAQLSWKEIP